nr:helix-turn-helix transcriptional regulator [Desulfobacula sp.]
MLLTSIFINIKKKCVLKAFRKGFILQLPERIKKIRITLGFSQLVFSKALGISRGHVSNLETGTVIPSDQLIKLICMKFGIEENWLRNGSGNIKVKLKSNITLEEDLDLLIEESDEIKYNTLFNALSLLYKTSENFIEFFDSQELIFFASDDFMLEPEHKRNEQIIRKSSDVEQSLERLKKRINRIKELKNYNENGEIV